MSVRWALLLTSLAPATAGAQGLAYEGGLSLATGEYIFTARTTSWTLTSGLSLRAGRFTLRAAAPLYIQNTTLLTGSGAGMMPSGGPSSGMVQDSSGTGGGMMGGRRRLSMPASAVTGYRFVVGDPAMQIGWHVLDNETAVTATLAAKAPLTDTTAFGTGAWDAGAALSMTRHFGPGTFLGVDVAYWMLGDLPELDFRNPVLGTLSAGRAFGAAWAGSIFVSGGTGALRGYDPPFAVGATAARLATPAMWGVSATIGLTETVPQVAVSLNWRLSLR